MPVPPDLNPGDTYHLVFTSSTGRNGESANIADYDALIQAAADAAGIGASKGVSWQAIASTATVAARDHAVVGATTPVYNMNLQRVANGNADFWDGALLHNLAFDEAGFATVGEAWTGSNVNGTSANGQTLGGATAWCGDPTAVGTAWINSSTPTTDTVLRVYGLSEILTAPAFSINAGLSDAWYNPATNGQGFFITVFPDIQSMFLAWFTFDTQRPPQSVTAVLGDPGHRWLTAFGEYSGDSATLGVELTEGGVFNSAQPPVVQGPDGTITVTFTSCNAGEVAYNITSAGVSGTIPIQRIALDNVPRCEALASSQ